MINLLSERKRKYSAEVAFYARLRAIAGVVLLIYGSFLGGFLLLLFLGTTQLNRVQASISKEENQLKQLAAEEAKYFLLTQKLDLIGTHLEKQSERQKALAEAYSFIIDGIEFSNVSFGEENKSVLVSVLARDIFILDSFVSQLNKAVTNKAFVQVEIRSIRRDGEGIYRFESEFFLSAPENPKGKN